MPESSRSKHRPRLKKTVRRSPPLTPVEYACHALACYKKQHGGESCEFEVVEAFGACRALFRLENRGVVDWCHVSFTARSRYADGSDASFFFVELADSGSGVFELEHYNISPADDYTEITESCGLCPSGEKYPHLPGSILGLENVGRDAITQSVMARCFKNQFRRKRHKFTALLLPIKSLRKIKKPVLKSKREIGTSEVKLPESSECKHCHRRLKNAVKKLPESSECKHCHRRLKNAVKRFPVLSNIKYAKHALACYEEEPDVEKGKFKVVKVLGACRTLLRIPGMEMFGVTDRCHVSFIAELRNPHGTDSASEFLFFVELGDWGTGVLELMHFRISHPDDSKITYGCEFCPKTRKYPHLSEYAGGLEKVPTVAGPQREMARLFKHQLIDYQVKPKPEGYKKEPVQTYFAPEFSDREYAEIALKHIHSKENVEYEIGRTYEACVRFLVFPEPQPGVEDVGEWCHVSFLAKPKNGVSEKLIFAEMVNDGKAKWIVHSYSILDPSGPDIAYGCGFCRGDNEEHPHPADASKYTAGHWPYSEVEL